ncbi:hypothetical protein BKA67DRAFT_551677 [Truncatella angustata]|uniref:Uncharacterized protein n=1 Tax=Truncatella angustata TaxID=152316 RepID=A0A9P8ZZT0_9PEZI|nr:uncharacterized protein BKA67DRAFT_551677 [Truncatella angustata]KAH6656344.1 hypothetical protein BKA67DRAFT_551677 [Truncatella angustata]
MSLVTFRSLFPVAIYCTQLICNGYSAAKRHTICAPPPPPFLHMTLQWLTESRNLSEQIAWCNPERLG